MKFYDSFLIGGEIMSFFKRLMMFGFFMAIGWNLEGSTSSKNAMVGKQQVGVGVGKQQTGGMLGGTFTGFGRSRQYNPNQAQVFRNIQDGILPEGPAESGLSSVEVRESIGGNDSIQNQNYRKTNQPGAPTAVKLALGRSFGDSEIVTTNKGNNSRVNSGTFDRNNQVVVAPLNSTKPVDLALGEVFSKTVNNQSKQIETLDIEGLPFDKKTTPLTASTVQDIVRKALEQEIVANRSQQPVDIASSQILDQVFLSRPVTTQDRITVTGRKPKTISKVKDLGLEPILKKSTIDIDLPEQDFVPFDPDFQSEGHGVESPEFVERQPSKRLVVRQDSIGQRKNVNKSDSSRIGSFDEGIDQSLSVKNNIVNAGVQQVSKVIGDVQTQTGQSAVQKQQRISAILSGLASRMELMYNKVYRTVGGLDRHQQVSIGVRQQEARDKILLGKESLHNILSEFATNVWRILSVEPKQKVSSSHAAVVDDVVDFIPKEPSMQFASEERPVEVLF